MSELQKAGLLEQYTKYIVIQIIQFPNTKNWIPKMAFSSFLFETIKKLCSHQKLFMILNDTGDHVKITEYYEVYLLLLKSSRL